jgi:hypothetical protein
VTPSAREPIKPSEAVAGILAAGGCFLGAMELFYRPFRMVLVAVILLLIATVMSGPEQRIVRVGFAIVGVCFVVGASIQVLAHHPLY